ncbi:MAG: hypothetical protein O3A82_10090 [Verrucomicrobia bacterium]|nr:hypothetical protein [Verrucomicrobiota bacterium]MDA1047263.1 hypothetical protein [Verrucomicrobiota bacterium]
MSRAIVTGMRVHFGVFLSFSLLCLGCETPNKSDELQLAEFKSDGCSLFVDGTFKDRELWKGCCVEHDVAYWKGGTAEERKAADLKFRECIRNTTGDETLALLMHEAVRAGGGPYFPTWYRWGYGWPQGRGYKALTDAEAAIVQQKLSEYRTREANATQ